MLPWLAGFGLNRSFIDANILHKDSLAAEQYPLSVNTRLPWGSDPQDAPSYTLYSNQFWHQTNQPQALFSQQFIQQKLAYQPNNPVAAGIVESTA